METQTRDETNREDRPEFTGQLWNPKDEDLSPLIKFQDMCRSCRRAVSNYFSKIAKISHEEELTAGGQPSMTRVKSKDS
jgi:hypothetical protein